MAVKLVVLCVLIFYLKNVANLNILGIFPHPAISHFRIHESLLKALAEKGHNVTVISALPQKNKIPRYRDISIEGQMKMVFQDLDVSEFKRSILHIFFTSFKIVELNHAICESLESEPIQQFLKTNETFDLILTEMFANDCYLGFVHKFKIPFVGLSPNVILPWTNPVVGNPYNPSFIPVILMPHSHKMTFYERVLNTVSYVVMDFVCTFFTQTSNYETAKKHFGNDLPPLTEISRNISVLLANSHFSLNFPRPFSSNVIEIGGAYLTQPQKLPQSLEKFVNDSEHGVIYFSFGSILKGCTIPENERNVFINVFSKLKQRVIWKWENDTMPNQPKNVLIQKWVPQFDLLCHPNVKVFITHGGMSSTVEAVHCGVPGLYLPQYGDQFLNSKSAVENGVGVLLNQDEVTETNVFQALQKLLHPSLKEKATKFSEIYNDRPLSPMKTAIYWIEYVARYNGAPHLRSPAVDMPFYQYHLLDVILFFVICVIVSILIIYYLCKYSIHFIFRRNLNSKMKLKSN